MKTECLLTNLNYLKCFFLFSCLVMPGEINSLVEVLALENLSMTFYMFPHMYTVNGENNTTSVCFFFFCLSCTHWVVQEKVWESLFATNMVIIVFRLGHSSTGPQNFPCKALSLFLTVVSL